MKIFPDENFPKRLISPTIILPDRTFSPVNICLTIRPHSLNTLSILFFDFSERKYPKMDDHLMKKVIQMLIMEVLLLIFPHRDHPFSLKVPWEVLELRPKFLPPTGMSGTFSVPPPTLPQAGVQKFPINCPALTDLHIHTQIIKFLVDLISSTLPNSQYSGQ